MAAERAGSSPGGQGKAVPVEETAVQLSLPVATAENPQGATRRRTRDRLGAVRAGVPKAIVNAKTAASATMEEVAYRLTSALLKVASKKGAPGPDGQTIEALLEQWPVVLPRLQADLLAGSYQPGAIRRRYIPKAGGGQRGLGIPDVIDRVVQEAVRQVLEPLWEPTFHPSSHGFRPGRSCHTAINEAKGHLKDGYEWCVDLDLEKFFDLVCHQRLAAKLAERVSDRRLLVLIGRMLKAKVVLPDGVVIDTEQGVPQGSPLRQGVRATQSKYRESSGNDAGVALAGGEVVSTSVAEIGCCRLGGLDQVVMVRGESVANPWFILLHGGPWLSEPGFFRYFNALAREELHRPLLADQLGADSFRLHQRAISPAHVGSATDPP